MSIKYLLLATSVLGLFAARAEAQNTFETIANGGFETGDLSGWTIVNTGAGSWVINDGTLDPVGPATPLPPITGSFDAMTDQTGPGMHLASQCFVVPPTVNMATLSWSDRIQNFATQGFSDPNQEFRVLITDPNGVQIGAEVYSTNPGDPPIQLGPNQRSFDLTSRLQGLAGQTICISFQEEDNLFYFNVTIDDVSLVIDTPNTPPAFDPFGQGCGADGFPTFYELFDGGNPNDLPGTGITMNWAGTGYVVTQGASGIVMPTGAPTPFNDDQTLQFPLPFGTPFPTQLGGTNDIWVCSNGFIALTATTAAPFVESVSLLLTSPGLLSVFWDDFNPAAGGAIHVEQDPSNPNIVHVTWLNVPQFSNTDSNTFQASLSVNGSVEYKWGAMTTTDGLAGYSVGGGTADPGGTDISMITAMPVGSGRPDLALALVTRPVVGTTFTVEVANLPTTAVFALLAIGVNQTNINLAPLGMPNCTQYTSAESIIGFVPTAPPHVVGVGIPNSPALTGLTVVAQAAGLVPGINMRGAIASEGRMVRVGDF